jgi:hypothetical protein
VGMGIEMASEDTNFPYEIYQSGDDFNEDEVIEYLKRSGFKLEEKFTDYFTIEGFGVEGYFVKNIWKHRTSSKCIFADQKNNWDKFSNSNLNLELPVDKSQIKKLILMLKMVGKSSKLEFYKY